VRHGLVVPEQAAYRPFPFEPHHEIDRSDPVRPAVDEVAEQPQPRVPTRPAQPAVDEPGAAQQRDEGVEMPVDVADDERRH